MKLVEHDVVRLARDLPEAPEGTLGVIVSVRDEAKGYIVELVRPDSTTVVVGALEDDVVIDTSVAIPA